MLHHMLTRCKYNILTEITDACVGSLLQTASAIAELRGNPSRLLDSVVA